MSERRVSVPLPSGGQGQGVEVPVDESNERWSEFTLRDGTTIRAKMTVISAVRIDGQYDPMGNPTYNVNFTPVFAVNSPDELRKKVQ